MRHRLVIEILRSSGGLVGHTSLDPDWEPAIEATRLAGLRTVGRWSATAEAERGINPLWHADLGEPFTCGFRVTLADQAGEGWHEDFSIRYFCEPARTAAAALVAQGALAAGESYLYRVLAYEPDSAMADGAPSRFATVDAPPPLVLHDVPSSAIVDSLPRHGDAQEGDFEVYIPLAVLDEASTLTAGAGDVETGGILIGHLGHDAPSDICVAITALVPARHTVNRATTLTFTSETWTDVRRAVALRGRGELVLGWFHSHPQQAWCREKGCSLDEQQRCSAAAGFFSTDDAALHRTMFPRAFSVALVMTHSVQGIQPRLFGWRTGLVAPRGYRVLTQSLLIGEQPHAPPIAV